METKQWKYNYFIICILFNFSELKIEFKFKDLAKNNMKIKKPYEGPNVILEIKPGY
jgi:hypothetical protein